MREIMLRAYRAQDAREWREQFVSFEVTKTRGRAPNKAKIAVYNLSLESIKYIEGASAVGLFVEGAALYVGDITSRLVLSRQDGPTRITEISAGSGRAAITTARVSLSYPAGMPRAAAVRDAVGSMGLAARGGVPDTGEIFASPWSFAGRASEVLDELAPGWSVQDGVLDFGEAIGRGAALRLAEGTGLIGAPERTDKGIRVNLVLRPEIQVHSVLAVESRFVSGYYRVREVTHKGDSRGGDWRTECLCGEL